MVEYKAKFIEFMLGAGALSFGEFTTKSGRQTPFFINTGKYKTGEQLALLAGFYADAIERDFGAGFDVLFGPAYKGIPLATAVACELYRRGKRVGYAFNRKELKDHGEGGALIGFEPGPSDRVLIIEDVTTAGTSVRESFELLRRWSTQVVGLVVSVDRLERGTGERSALAELGEQFGLKTLAIVTMAEVVDYLRQPRSGSSILSDELYQRILSYWERYGAKQR